MKIWFTSILAAAMCCILSSPSTAQTFVNWTGNAGDWSNRNGWFNESLGGTGFLPSADFGEIARIDDGGVVTASTALANGSDQGSSTNPGELQIGVLAGTGELIVSSTGTLRIEDTEQTTGALTLGGAGNGVLRVLPGGALTADGAINTAASASNAL
jgi:hypothetical protein